MKLFILPFLVPFLCLWTGIATLHWGLILIAPVLHGATDLFTYTHHYQGCCYKDVQSSPAYVLRVKQRFRNANFLKSKLFQLIKFNAPLTDQTRNLLVPWWWLKLHNSRILSGTFSLLEFIDYDRLWRQATHYTLKFGVMSKSMYE